MQAIEGFRREFIAYLKEKNQTKVPVRLYEPITYILNLGGKRLRPVLTLMTTEIFDGTYTEAFDAALAIEIFHNFSLVHDDIMDDAPLRRGKATVHEKWDVNTGILSGDAMLIEAYRHLEGYDGHKFKALVQLFSKTALQVCEGQQFDMDFEDREDVTIPEYLKMIEYKTAVLVAAAMKMGALIAGAPEESQDMIYAFGRHLGIAFQLQDDYLDAFGDPKTFGKQVGGDIIENKKTFLYLKSMEFASKKQRKELEDLYSIQPKNNTGKIQTVKEIFIESGGAESTKKAIEKYTQEAFVFLEKLKISEDKKESLRQFGLQLMGREV